MSGAFDPFSKPAFYPLAEASAEGMARGETAVTIAADEFGVVLDSTPESVGRVDSMLDEIGERHRAGRLDEDAATRYATTIGCYVAEVLRRELGGSGGVFRLYSETMLAVEVHGRSTATFLPIGTARARIEGRGVSLQTEYERAVRRATADPAAGDALRRALIRPRSRYRLRHDQGYFETGLVSKTRQALIGFFFGGLLTIYFDAHGRLLGHEVTPPPADPPKAPAGGPMMTAEYEKLVARATSEHQRSLRFKAAPILIQRFNLPERGVGIEDRPDHLERFLEAPDFEAADDAERRELVESVRKWEEDGSFVLYWGNDLWVNAEGEVTSS